MVNGFTFTNRTNGIDMELTLEQQNAVEICTRRINNGEGVTRLFGYAGTGKTTIAKTIADLLDNKVVFGAYTGKAASVLTQKGCPAHTIHSMFYWGVDHVDDNGRLIKAKEFDPGKFRGRYGYPRAIILDEVSMVDEKMARDIMSLGIPVLAIGDPAQLPPVKGCGWFTNGEPDAMLTEPARHGGIILELATDVRTNGLRALGHRQYRDIVVGQVSQSRALEFDQILCGTNATRHARNNLVRKLHGNEDEFIVAGERIICLDNNSNFNGVLNGRQFRVTDAPEDDEGYSKHGIINLQLECECRPDGTGVWDECPVCEWSPYWLPTWIPGFTGPEGEKWLKDLYYTKRQVAMAATYGYVITTHKAQGSEWEDVLVINESGVFRKDASRWLYTAITRAQKSITIIPRRMAA